MRAYILINVHTGELPNVVHQLKRLEQVREATMTFGPYDAVATVEANDINDLGRILATVIQPIPGVEQTLTCLAVDI
jgi:DNA-binding Lrp family transcriptional regulator